MALTIEDGTGIVAADSYQTRAEFITYASDYMGGVIADDADADAAMRRAFVYLNGLRWVGSRTWGRNQRGELPRTDMGDVPSNEVPVEVKDAQCILAFYEHATPNVLSPLHIGRDAVKSEEVTGAVKVEYAVPTDGVTSQDARAYVASALEMIAPFLVAGQVESRTGYTPSAFVAY